MDTNLSKPRMSADNTARCPRCRDPRTAWGLKLKIPIGKSVCLHCQRRHFPLSVFSCLMVSALYLPRLVRRSPGRRKVVVTPQVFKELNMISIVRRKTVNSPPAGGDTPDVEEQRVWIASCPLPAERRMTRGTLRPRIRLRFVFPTLRHSLIVFLHWMEKLPLCKLQREP